MKTPTVDWRHTTSKYDSTGLTFGDAALIARLPLPSNLTRRLVYLGVRLSGGLWVLYLQSLLQFFAAGELVCEMPVNADRDLSTPAPAGEFLLSAECTQDFYAAGATPRPFGKDQITCNINGEISLFNPLAVNTIADEIRWIKRVGPIPGQPALSIFPGTGTQVALLACRSEVPA